MCIFEHNSEYAIMYIATPLRPYLTLTVWSLKNRQTCYDGRNSVMELRIPCGLLTKEVIWKLIGGGGIMSDVCCLINEETC